MQEQEFVLDGDLGNQAIVAFGCGAFQTFLKDDPGQAKWNSPE